MRGLRKNPVVITYGHGERFYPIDGGRMTPERGTAFSGMGKKMDTIEIQVLAKMTRSVRFVLMALILMLPGAVLAGPADEANAVVDRFSAAYCSNDPEAVVRLYAPDAILLGTVSPVMSVGTEAIRKYFSMIKDSGNKNVIQERRTIVLGDNAAVVTGFYEFTRMQEGRPVSGPSRFTMLLVRSDGEWRIAHHHSSPLVLPKK